MMSLPLQAIAQQAASPAVPTTPVDDQKPDGLRVYFASGSAALSPVETATLDQAARLFREGSPIVMVVSGAADTVGRPERNLTLSIRRAQAVADALVARGIPAERLQVLGRGNSELPVATSDGVDTRENRVVDISWR